MNVQTPSTEWKRLGVANVVLLLGRSLVVIGILSVCFWLFLYILTPIVEDPQLQDSAFPFDRLFLGFKVIFGLILGGQVVSALMALLRHFATRYRLAPDCVMHQGGVYRTFSHTIPAIRVQGVEVSADVFQRMLGVSTVTITTAGVHSPNMTIVNVPTVDAVAIQAQLGVDHG